MYEYHDNIVGNLTPIEDNQTAFLKTTFMNN